jgi:hypothetical protein
MLSLSLEFPPAKEERHPPPLPKRQTCEARSNQTPFSELLNNHSVQRTPNLDDAHYTAE